MTKNPIKTPISYYGGKQTMLKHIKKLIPKHKTYTEAFAGGAAVFWSKEPSEVEVINDINGELINFYSVLQDRYEELKTEIDRTLHARQHHCLAGFIYNHPQFFSEVKRAWALWVLSKMSFASKLDGSWGYDVRKNHMAKKIKNARIQFADELRERLQMVQIESNDALKIIKSRDTEETFHFVDPPYIGSNMGHYKGYTEADFEELLKLLESVKGKFMLTMYPNPVLQGCIERNNWKVQKITRTISVSKVSRRKQEEWIVMNY